MADSQYRLPALPRFGRQAADPNRDIPVDPIVHAHLAAADYPADIHRPIAVRLQEDHLAPLPVTMALAGFIALFENKFALGA